MMTKEEKSGGGGRKGGTFECGGRPPFGIYPKGGRKVQS